jgi:hypothetical protein
MAVVTISGKRKRDIFRVKRDIDDFKVVDGKLSGQEQPKMKRIGEKLFFSPETTVNPTMYLKDGEKIMVNTDTKEVRIR